MERPQKYMINFHNPFSVKEIKKTLLLLITEKTSLLSNFAQITEENIEIDRLKAGTNQDVFGIKIEDPQNKLKIEFIAKKKEGNDPLAYYYSIIKDHLLISQYGPKIYYADRIWMIEEKVIGKTIGFEAMHNDDICFKIIKEAAHYANKMKSLDITKLNKDNIIVDMIKRNILTEIEEEFARIQESHPKNLCDLIQKFISLFHEPNLRRIYESVNQKNYKFIIAHGDVNFLNVIKKDDDGEFLLLDFENSCYHPIAYDIAYVLMNRLVIFKADSMFFLPEKIHSEELLRELTRIYLGNLDFINDENENEDFFENVVECVKKCLLLVNLFWGIWAIFKIRTVKDAFNWESCMKVRLEMNEYILLKYFS